MNQPDVAATPAAIAGAATLCSDMVDSVHTNSVVGPWEFRFLHGKYCKVLFLNPLRTASNACKHLGLEKWLLLIYPSSPLNSSVPPKLLTHKQPSCSCTSYYQFYQSPFHLSGFPQWSSDQTLDLSSSWSLLAAPAVILPWYAVVIASW